MKVDQLRIRAITRHYHDIDTMVRLLRAFTEVYRWVTKRHVRVSHDGSRIVLLLERQDGFGIEECHVTMDTFWLDPNVIQLMAYLIHNLERRAGFR